MACEGCEVKPEEREAEGLAGIRMSHVRELAAHPETMATLYWCPTCGELWELGAFDKTSAPIERQRAEAEYVGVLIPVHA
ncbi:hypothetical protein FGE12_02610 [Aggregicoccus sp. 17bor-14]|uniref:hypothetical protein n=1 Tax=Myxococcaceae TaxID=31 RepID=UPI00129C36E1|nr:MULTISPECIES: hypothetical protein [Myxococcaceae]MBF5041262.1 hypothetical protein [Simulacricoccus sp. 17bor-14]MRI87048.1 hypothetical protein [Aggregicoccus sp. 17bor-14]